MKNVLIAGAGKSSASLITYMLQHSQAQGWTVTVMDANITAIEEKIAGHPNGRAVALDIHNEAQRRALVAAADIVLSVMPPHLHFLLAQDCIALQKHLITSSYVSDDIQSLDAAAKAAGLLFMCEMGCDPGIDHLSTAKLFDEIHEAGGSIGSFVSCCGGLVAPESDTNLWHYKISWNPHNVVTAAKSGAVWYEDGAVATRAYEDIFKHKGDFKIDGLEGLVYYPNRDSLRYKEIFHQPQIKTFIRATLRHHNFMHGWQHVVALKLTNENDSIALNGLTYKAWIAQVNQIPLEALEDTLRNQYVFDDLAFQLFEELGILSDTPILLDAANASSAKILQEVIERKWVLQEHDKDMIVMQHLVSYEKGGTHYQHESSLIVKGDNRLHSAMAKTVGLPMAILAHKILDGTFDTRLVNGVQIPIQKEVYTLVLPLLEQEQIGFVHKEVAL